MSKNPRKHSSNTSGLQQQSLLRFLPPSSPLHQSSLHQRRASKSKGHPLRMHSRRKVRGEEMTDDQEQGDLSSDVEAIHFEPRHVPDPSDVEDDHADHASQSPRRPQRLVADPTRSVTVVHVVSSDEVGSDEDMPIPPRGKRKGKARAMTVDNSSSEDKQPAPKKRKFTKGERPLTPEPDSLADEVEQSRIIQSRLRTRDKKSQFQKHLENLKRKKKGQMPLSSSGSDGESEGSPDTTPFVGARPGDVSGNEDPDENEEDTFIVEDDEAPPTLPAEFSMNSHQDLIHHFKIICQLFIHLLVRPAAEKKPFMELVLKEDEYFSVPLRMTRRKLFGLRDSLVASSVWRSDFRKSLETYPHFSLVQLDFALPHCDACHLGGRLSTLCGRLDGHRYDQLSFEDLETSSLDEDSSDGDDDVSTVKEFNLGRFCAARTQTFHRFSHWEYHLYDALRQEVDELRLERPGGKPKFVRVAYSKGLLPPEDLGDADSIMDWLDQRGIINTQWQKVREMMESARKLEMVSGKNEDDIDLNT